ncbi:MAG: adenosylcobalamin-dependent ribonucleoside-diphosphate reductase, partial [Deinococcus sp.]|nr:adenosylcobalamin-dependent ribonucleoside-diphosphate reductase [Deinococcus sp.]
HPDILEFIHCKEKDGEISNFNISVGITDAFMRSVENDQDFELRSPHDGSVWHTLKAREIFREIVRGAYRNGEPGVLFLDRMNRWNPAPHLYELEATNPCGEQSLGPFENCCLGSINLAKHVTLEHTIDWARLERTVHSSVHFLDNVIDANKYVPAIPQLREWALRTRRIGLGIMGFGDLLYEIGVSYATPEGEAVAEQVVEFIAYHSKLASVELAKKRGRFPEFEGSIYSRGELGFPLPEGTSKGRFGRPDLRWAKVQAAVKEYGIRNSCTNTVAPTGTIGTVAGVEGYGCEPVFALAYYRNMRDGDKLIQLPYVSPAFERVAKEQGFWSKDLAQVLAKTGSCQNLAEVPVEVQGVFVTARDITPEGHVRMQAAFQRFTDNSISKTINFPAEATEQDVEKAYFLAWQLGLKGLTVYRDGSRDTQVLNVGNAEAQLAEVTEAAPIQASNGHTSAPEPVQLSAPASNGHASEPRPSEVKPARLPAESVASTGLALGEGVTPPAEPVTLPVVQPRERPVVTTGTTEAVNTGCGKLYVTINEDERGLAEVFARLGRSGGCAAAQTEAIGRMVSLALRAGVDPAQVTRQLRGIRCPAPAWNNGQTILSCADAIAVAMSHHLGLEPMPVAPKAEHDPLAAKLQASAPGQHSAVSSQEELRGLNPQCPECGGYIKYVEGCVVCGTCGYTRCG